MYVRISTVPLKCNVAFAREHVARCTAENFGPKTKIFTENIGPPLKILVLTKNWSLPWN